MATNPLRELNKVGQSVWQDNISRGQLKSGGLKRLIDEDGLSGVTSNPTIFGKAIEGSTDYDEAISKAAAEGKEGPAIFDALAIEDIQQACDLFRPTYDATQGRDGFVSIEVSPTLAHDTTGSMAEARRDVTQSPVSSYRFAVRRQESCRRTARGCRHDFPSSLEGLVLYRSAMRRLESRRHTA